jgi:PEP-CTERM motif
LPDHLSTLGNQLSQDDVRARGYPVIEADPNDATGQTLYLTWAEDPDGTINGDEADIFFSRSTNGGATWSNIANPLRVNSDSTINDQFAPWMDVKPDGTIDIAWYDKRLAPNDDAWDVYIARSTDGGLSFGPNVRLTDVTYNTTQASNNEPWLGEYLGLVVDSTTAYVGFTRRGDANGDVYFDSIPNAQIVPEPASAALMAGLLLACTWWRRRK